MFVWDVRGMFRRCHQGRLWGVVLVLGLADRASTCPAADVAGVRVQEALQAEIQLDASKRAELIDAALRVDPKSEEAHWARGEVRVGGEWRSLEDSAADVLSQANILKYWERRAEAGNTVKDQLRLADYCRTNGMSGAERAHLMAVVSLDPNHRDARRRLGQVNVDGAWIDLQEAEQRKKRELATAAYLKKHGKRLMALAAAFHDKSKSEERVLKELREFDSPLVIPGLELCFSSRGESGALCTVETVAAMAAPEASLSLARHALAFSDRVVRKRAIEYLKERDEFSYVPDLLGALQSPVAKSDGFETNRQNQLVWRRRLMSETQGSKQVADLDRIFQFSSRKDLENVLNPQFGQLAVIEADAELNTLNSGIEDRNEQIMQLLVATRGEEDAEEAANRKTPEEWWNWWNNRIETYPSDPKYIAYVHETSYIDVPPPPPPLPPVPSAQPPRSSCECLAAGTPIWTETGPLAVNEIKVGDLVLTQNQRTGELKFAPVLLTTTRPPERLLQLKINNETVRATGGHLFWVTGRGWTKARSLQSGMGLHAARGFAVIDSVTEEEEPVETYNLIVDECHSYFVGKNLVLSHDNTACQPVTNRVPGLK